MFITESEDILCNCNLKKEGILDISEVRKIAKRHGIKTAKLKKGEIIRLIQRAEGNFDCFGTAASGECSQTDCLWRKDCLTEVSGGMSLRWSVK